MENDFCKGIGNIKRINNTEERKKERERERPSKEIHYIQKR
jgi:hypothetical protein